MRTKTLLLTAALVAATSASALAQVYSVNAVGYVNLTVPANGLAILANPLNGTNNNLNTIIPLGDGQDGVTIYRYDTTLQGYSDPISFVCCGEGLGWLSATDPNPTIAPGEGFWIQNPLPTPLNLTFVGEVPQGSLSNPIPGGNQLALRSSMVPQELRLGTNGQPNTLQWPAAEADTIYIFDTATQGYKDPYSFVEGLGWLSASDPDALPDGPMIKVGQGFWSIKAAPAANWNRTFSVN
jgi:hypothetical protein